MKSSKRVKMKAEQPLKYFNHRIYFEALDGNRVSETAMDLVIHR